jgi:CsoR family transcriptional regulator, copper-sensing transcriptional repressor
LSSTGQAGLTQVDIPMRGNSHACAKIHKATIKSKINKSFIFIFLFLMRDAGIPACLDYMLNVLTDAINMLAYPQGVYMTSDRRKILNRLRRIEGQIRGLQRLVEAEAPCVEVITQLSAVTSAMKKTAGAIISNNMNNCLDEAVEDPEKARKDFQGALSRFIDLS